MPVGIGFTCCCDPVIDPPLPVGCCCINGQNDPTKTTREDCIFAGGTWYDEPCDQVDCSGGGGGGGCVDGCTVNIPELGPQPGVISCWDILASSYDRSSGDWSLKAKSTVRDTFSEGRVASYGGANAKISTHVPPPNAFGGVGAAYPLGTVVTITGTSTPPTFANCGEWRFNLISLAVIYLGESWTSEKCGVLTTCCPGKYIPTVLTVRVSGGTCPGSGPMTWDGGAWRSDGLVLNIDLSCVTGVGWYLQVDFDAQLADVVCNPFSATAFFYGTQCGDIVVTITE